MKTVLLLALLFVGMAAATQFYSEPFDATFTERWVASTAKPEAERGELVHEDGGAKTSQDARHYQYSAKFPTFSNKDKTLVFQYNVRHTQRIDCGGAYLKLLPEGVDQDKFDGDSPYNIMFGPDVCGATRRVHFIIHYNGENHLIREDIPLTTDTYTHVYTLIIKPDQSYQVLIDNEEVRAGNIVDDFDVLPPKEIKDPDAVKPADWVDEAEIDDPEDKKPEGWDDIPETIPDPDAKKPEDWDDELDGEWVAPTIANPEYKGEWKPKRIPNPDYKGPWEHPMVPNPDFAEDDSIYSFDTIGGAGLEIWQVKSGTVFSDVLVTDDPEEAKTLAEAGIAQRDAQKKKEQEEAEAARKKREEEAAAKKAEQEAAAAAAAGGDDDADKAGDDDDAAADDKPAGEADAAGDADSHDEL